MESSPEQDNFVKLSYILLDIVAQYLREYFVELGTKSIQMRNGMMTLPREISNSRAC